MLIKKCKICEQFLDRSLFYKDKKGKDGLHGYCKSCTKNKRTEYRNSAEGAAYMLRWRKENKDKGRKHAKTYRNSSGGKRNMKQYLEKNKEKISKQQSTYYKKNFKKIQEWQADYYKSDTGKAIKNAHGNRRRAIQLKATPEWANLEKIKVLYEKAIWLESITGLKYHVDHIIPLKGVEVCGLHVWENLQILEASLNLKKNNKWEVL